MKRLLLPVLLLSLAAPAFAQDAAKTAPVASDAPATPVAAPAAAPAPIKGDAAMGKQLAYTCTGCHGIDQYKNAYPSYRVPKIGGQNEQYIRNALTEYAKGERNHPTMKAQAQSFSPQDIADIAAYLTSLKKSAK
jgi:cytochrome c553